MIDTGLNFAYHTDPAGWSGGACYSGDDQLYRYSLSYEWRGALAGLPSMTWIMLNPSTATHTRFDPTLRRCRGYATRWGFGGMAVLNLWALRSRDPRQLRYHPDPVGPDNDKVIDLHLAIQQALYGDAHLVVCGWGGAGPARSTRPLEVQQRVTAAGHTLHCLARTAAGQPVHPLYQRRDLDPVPYDPPLEPARPQP